MKWKADTEFWTFLRVLGFQEVSRCPKMKDVVKMFRRTALKKHPDKPGGSTQEFQQLQEAFKKAGQYLENAKLQKNIVDIEEDEDVEENAARKLFKEFYLNGETYQSDFLKLKLFELFEQRSMVELAADLPSPPLVYTPPSPSPSQLPKTSPPTRSSSRPRTRKG